MTDAPDASDAQAVPHAVPPEELSPEDLARLLAAAGSLPTDVPNKGALRRKLIIAILIAGIGVGASVLSCVGQSFSYRQAHAMEGIEQQLKEIRAGCVAAPKSEGSR